MPDPPPLSLDAAEAPKESHSLTLPASNQVPSSPTLSETPKKKSRLQWDEQNLLSNALEMERTGPRMKIDEPKTPFVLSETGSSTSGSAHQSPPESPSFIPTEQLLGFQSLENHIPVNSNPALSDDSTSTHTRAVHIKDDSVHSGGSSPRSRQEFEARRKAHYRNEALAGMQLRRSKMLLQEEEHLSTGHQTDQNIAAPNGAPPNGVCHNQPQDGDPHLCPADCLCSLNTQNPSTSSSARMNGHNV